MLHDNFASKIVRPVSSNWRVVSDVILTEIAVLSLGYQCLDPHRLIFVRPELANLQISASIEEKLTPEKKDKSVIKSA